MCFSSPSPGGMAPAGPPVAAAAPAPTARDANIEAVRNRQRKRKTKGTEPGAAPFQDDVYQPKLGG